jgi:hypothetical protein
MKKCNKCNEVKLYEFFYKNKNIKDGFHNHCKVCVKEYKANNKKRLKEYHKEYNIKNKEIKKEYYKEYRLNNKEKIKEYQKQYIKEYHLNNKEKIKEYSKEYYENNREKAKEYYLNNKEKINKYNKEYRLNNKVKRNEFLKNRRQNDNLFKFSSYTRSLINNSFKRNNNKFKKNPKTEIILGCTIEEFRSYIEMKFDKKMTFENYGKWHLDHIIPISIAKTEEEIIKLNHYTNFQPLWAIDNLKKGNKIIDNTQLKLI